MAAALDWIGHIAETIIRCFPHLKIIKLTQMALKMRKGNELTVLGPGLHWWWPIITTVDVVTAVRDTQDLSGQTFTTKDGKSVLASGMIVYQVSDVEKLLTTAPDHMNTVNDIAMTVIHDTLIKYEWEELRVNILSGVIPKELRRAAHDELKVFGIKVLSLGLKDLAPVRVFKIINDI